MVVWSGGLYFGFEGQVVSVVVGGGGGGSFYAGVVKRWFSNFVFFSLCLAVCVGSVSPGWVLVSWLL